MANKGDLIKLDYLVEKRNVLNEIRANSMTLQELRFFSIYLAKINARDVSTRVVRFPMADFQKIMDLKKANISYLMNATDSLLCKIVKVPLATGGYEAFQIFKQCRVTKDEYGEWFVEIDAHDEALPLMFEFKEKYFTYELWNALRLKSSNQLRMYEILKQYEKLGTRIIYLDDLKELLGLDKKDYPRYGNFKIRVLDVSQKALTTYTDIKFDYEPIKKKDKGGKIIALKFNISHNSKYTDPISLADFIDVQSKLTDKFDKETEIEFENDRMEFLAEACENEFNEAEIKVLYNLISQILPNKVGETHQGFLLRVYDHLKHRYDELNWRAGQKEIKSRFGYLKKILEADVKEEYTR